MCGSFWRRQKDGPPQLRGNCLADCLQTSSATSALPTHTFWGIFVCVWGGWCWKYIRPLGSHSPTGVYVESLPGPYPLKREVLLLATPAMCSQCGWQQCDRPAQYPDPPWAELTGSMSAPSTSQMLAAFGWPHGEFKPQSPQAWELKKAWDTFLFVLRTQKARAGVLWAWD